MSLNKLFDKFNNKKPVKSSVELSAISNPVESYLDSLTCENDVNHLSNGYNETVKFLLDNPDIYRNYKYDKRSKAALWVTCYHARNYWAEWMKPSEPVIKIKEKTVSTERPRGNRYDIIGNISVDLLAAKYGIYETTLAKNIEMSFATLKRGAKIVVLDKKFIEVMSPDLQQKFIESFEMGNHPVYCLADIYSLPPEYFRKKP